MTQTRGTLSTAQDPAAAQDATAAPATKLADPPIPGGRVEAVMGALIRVLAHSPLARPLPAVSLSALGLGLVAFTGLCATAPATGGRRCQCCCRSPRWRTGWARRRCPPAHQLHHERRHHTVLPRPGLDAVGEQPRLAPEPPAGLLDRGGGGRGAGEHHPGRLIGRGELRRVRAHRGSRHSPYVYLPTDLPGGLHNPYTALVGIQWVRTPSVYGPVATWMHLAAALVAGSRPWLAIWVLMIVTGIGFLAAGYVLLRSAANPVRASLLWAANPLLIYLFVMSGHLDTFVALAGIVAILISRRGATVWHDLAIGLVIGLAGGIKINAAFVGLGIAVLLIRNAPGCACSAPAQSQR